MHDIVVRIQHWTTIGIDGGGPHGQLMHARLAQDDAIGIHEARHQGRAVAWHPACAEQVRGCADIDVTSGARC